MLLHFSYSQSFTVPEGTSGYWWVPKFIPKKQKKNYPVCRGNVISKNRQSKTMPTHKISAWVNFE